VVVAELAQHGARRGVRIGTCAALDSGLAAGDSLLVGAVLAADGTSRAVSKRAPEPDPSLTAALAAATGLHPVTVASSDLFHDPAAPDRRAAWLAAGAAATDLESAAVLAVGTALGLAVGAVLVVGETAGAEHDEQATELGLLRVGRAAAAALDSDSRVAQRPASETSSPL